MSAMAPSRSTHRNLTADRLAKMELGSGQQQQQHSQSETSSSPARFQPASSGQPQQPPQSSSSSSSSSSSPFRFGAPDSRASYSERRLMNHSSSVRSTTAHNHPLGNGHQQQQHQHQSWGSGSHHTSSEGRSFNNAGLTALSRSNGSLAPSDKDASSSKPRSRTQVRKIIRSSSFQSPKRLDFASFLSLSLSIVWREEGSWTSAMESGVTGFRVIRSAH